MVYFLLRILKLSVQILRCYHFFNIFWIFWSRWLLLLWTPSKRLDQLTKKKKKEVQGMKTNRHKPGKTLVMHLCVTQTVNMLSDYYPVLQAG